MKRKSFLSVLLALVMLLSLAAVRPAVSAEAAPGTTEDQVNLLFSSASKWKQTDKDKDWYYMVSDLDHDGRLELVAASQHPLNRSTNLKVWEVNDKFDALVECSLKLEEDESFPDILTDNADTFHNTETGTWSYLFYDHVVLSESEVYTLKCSVSMVDGVISYDSYAVEHTEVINGIRFVEHTDSNGFAIAPEQYNEAGVNAFISQEKSNTNFDWFVYNDTSISRMLDSYAVFIGDKEPTEVFPVPRPAVLEEEPPVTPTPVPEAAPIPTPVPTPVPESKPLYLTITKNPTNENRKPGSTALFVACANIFDSLTWTLVAPDGGQYSVQSFAHMFADAPVSGEYSTTLSIGNVAADMNGWGAFCTFYYNGQTARTSTAYIYVKDKNPAPQPSQPVYGSMYGRAYHDTAFTEYIVLSDGSAFHVNGNNCRIRTGVYVDGSQCIVFYTDYPSEANIYQVDIYGEENPYPEEDQGGWAGSQYYENEEDQGGWAGSQYYENEEDQGGWAGSQYYEGN